MTFKLEGSITYIDKNRRIKTTNMIGITYTQGQP